MRAFLSLACAALLSTVPVHGASKRYQASKQLEFGVEMALQGSWREAAFRFRKAVDLDPGNAFALNNLGVALESTGDFEKAKEAYSKALELDSDNDRIRENLDRLEAYLASRLFRPASPGKKADEPADEEETAKQGGEDGP